MDKAKILVIDDEQGFLDLMTEQLELGGYEVTTALNGESAIKKARRVKPDIVICDVRMPKKDGFEVLRELRKAEDFQAPFIMLTALDDFDKIKEAYKDEADFYVTKPVRFHKLLENIRILLNLSEEKIR